MRPNWFIAWPVVLASGALEALTAGAPHDVRPFVADDLHLTLAFLGDVDEALARAVWAHLLDDLPRVVTVTFDAVAPFGDPRSPSALSLTVARGRDALCDAIAARADGLLAVAGRPPERRAPRPHVTIARPHRKATNPRRLVAVAWAESLTPPGDPITLDRLALYTWAADRRTRQFDIVESAALPSTSAGD